MTWHDVASMIHWALLVGRSLAALANALDARSFDDATDEVRWCKLNPVETHVERVRFQRFCTKI
jgi:hypothetical protein